MPNYTQCASRVAGTVGGKPSYYMVVIAGIVIAVIAIGFNLDALSAS